MTQQIINYGASANDGTGDPLRTAFIKTDNNFNQIWNAGPVGSNITILNNTIGVTNTNGNLILSPNGIGVIQTNNTLVPRANVTYDLGSSNLAYRTVYANSATFQAVSVAGDLSVSGNLTVQGNIIQVGNIVTETLTIQLANAATTANAANGSGITVGASDNIATLLYNSTSNVWTTNIGLSAVGNVTAPYFIGNGSQLTGIISSYGNSNVTVLLSNLGSNVISGTGNITTTGNISGGFILGNISQATGFPATYGNANVANYLPTFSGNISAGNVSATGNISGAYVKGNGSELTGISTANIGNVTFDDNIVIGTGSQDGYLGLYLAIGPDSVANSQYLQVRGGDNLTHIHLDTGNNAYFDQYFGNDNKFVKLEAGDAGNVVIGTDDTNGNLYKWTFDSSGNFTVAGNIQTVTTGFPFTSSISGINTGNPTVLVTLTDAVFGAPETGQVTISSVVGTTEANNTWYYLSIDPSNFQLYYDSALQNPVDGTGWTTYVSGGLAVAQGYNDLGITGRNVSITTNTGNTWTFGGDGSLTFPGNLVIAGNANVFGTNRALIQPADDLPLIALSSGANGAVSSVWVEDIGNVGTSNIAAVYANPTVGSKIVRIVVGQNGVGSGPNLWDFDTTGNLTVPGNIIMTTGIVGSGASPAPYLSGFSSVSAMTVSASGNVTGAYVKGNGSELTNLPAPAVAQDITSVGNMSIMTYDGNLKYVSYATVEPASGNIAGGNISAIGNISSGNLITAGNVSGNTAGFAIGYRDIPQVSFAGNATIATTDAGKHFYSTQSSNFTLTIANNASQGFQVGAAITVVNQGTGTITIAQGSGVTLYIAGNATSGNRSVATFGMATIMKVATDTWFINGTGVS